ncbi:hypothetical protein [Pseudonocardia sp.]|uniref:hypothetical protein n=1 Tax=Pseudonocardia sp. TaxID=60912 RepID=UPI00261A6423|nr:hypothetical protein [Pseudonocardia sp.]
MEDATLPVGLNETFPGKPVELTVGAPRGQHERLCTGAGDPGQELSPGRRPCARRGEQEQVDVLAIANPDDKV